MEKKIRAFFPEFFIRFLPVKIKSFFKKKIEAFHGKLFMRKNRIFPIKKAFLEKKIFELF